MVSSTPSKEHHETIAQGRWEEKWISKQKLDLRPSQGAWLCFCWAPNFWYQEKLIRDGKREESKTLATKIPSRSAGLACEDRRVPTMRRCFASSLLVLAFCFFFWKVLWGNRLWMSVHSAGLSVPHRSILLYAPVCILCMSENTCRTTTDWCLRRLWILSLPSILAWKESSFLCTSWC